MPFSWRAYASMPPDAQEQEEYYRILGKAGLISGAELLFPGEAAHENGETKVSTLVTVGLCTG